MIHNFHERKMAGVRLSSRHFLWVQRLKKQNILIKWA